MTVESEPSAIAALLDNFRGHYCRVGLNAVPLSQWLYSGLAAADYPVICVETQQMNAALSAQINKTDRNDARGIAQMMRVGLYRPVHLKTERSQEDPDVTDSAEVPGMEDLRRREQPTWVAAHFFV